MPALTVQIALKLTEASNVFFKLCIRRYRVRLTCWRNILSPVEFISSNIWLFLAVVVSGGYLLLPKLMLGGASAKNLDPQGLVQLINRERASIVDLRDYKEFESGSIVGAKNIPFSALKERAAELKKLEKRPIALVCASGSKARMAEKLLSKEGYEDLYVLSGGLSAWKQASLPTSR